MTTSAPIEQAKLQGDELLQAVQKQLEFYFSPQNLANDAFLVAHMSKEMYVNIDVIANFKILKSMTEDVAIIKQAASHSSVLVLDPTGTKIKAKNLAVQRNTIILREIPLSTPVEQIKQLFAADNQPKHVQQDVLDMWYVTFDTEAAAQSSLQHLRTQTFNNNPIKARIKSENLQKTFLVQQQQQAPPPQSVYASPPSYPTPYYSSPQQQQQQYPYRAAGGRYQHYNATNTTTTTTTNTTNNPKRGNFEKKKHRRNSQSEHKQQQSAYAPLPTISQAELDKPGYETSFIKYPKQTMLDIFQQQAANLKKPATLVASAIVRDTPLLELELTKPITDDHAVKQQDKKEDLQQQQQNKVKSFAEAAITAKDIKTPERKQRSGSNAGIKTPAATNPVPVAAATTTTTTTTTAVMEEKPTTSNTQAATKDDKNTPKEKKDNKRKKQHDGDKPIKDRDGFQQAPSRRRANHKNNKQQDKKEGLQNQQQQGNNAEKKQNKRKRHNKVAADAPKDVVANSQNHQNEQQQATNNKPADSTPPATTNNNAETKSNWATIVKS